jgi:nucleotide-binding universal stress UspA family protein
MNSSETFPHVNGGTRLAGQDYGRVCCVLVPLDFSSSTAKVLEFGKRIAARFNAVVRVLHVVQLNIAGEERGIPREALVRHLADDARRELYKLIARFWASDLVVTIRVREGRPHEAIVQEACESKAGMIIMGTQNRTGLSRLLQPSILGRVVRKAPCPVLAVGPGYKTEPSFWSVACDQHVPEPKGERRKQFCSEPSQAEHLNENQYQPGCMHVRFN